jgi:hypothetical protein
MGLDQMAAARQALRQLDSLSAVAVLLPHGQLLSLEYTRLRHHLPTHTFNVSIFLESDLV